MINLNAKALIYTKKRMSRRSRRKRVVLELKG